MYYKRIESGTYPSNGFNDVENVGLAMKVIFAAMARTEKDLQFEFDKMLDEEPKQIKGES